MLQVESESYYVDSSLQFNKNNAGTYTYQSAPQPLDNFTTDQSYLEPNMVGGGYSTSERYFVNEGTMVTSTDTSVIGSNCEVTGDTANLTGEQIFQEAMRYVQEQTESTNSDFSNTSSYSSWENYAPDACKFVVLHNHTKET